MSERTTFDTAATEGFDSDAKIGLLATVDGDGLPHVTLITTLLTHGPRGLIWGQFTEGQSKANVRRDPRTAFAVLSPERALWRGQATWTHSAREGEQYEAFNRRPMFRYNTYFGIHTVHYMDLVRTSPREPLPYAGMAAGALAVAGARWRLRPPAGERALRPWAEQHLASPATFKFVVWVRADGHPNIVPMVPSLPVDGRWLVLARTVYREELSHIPEDAPVAVFAVNMQAESVLVRGRFNGFRRRVPVGTLDIDRVYNTMPPTPGQIWPAVPLEPVTDFGVIAGGPG
jgi:hypothetical protein